MKNKIKKDIQKIFNGNMLKSLVDDFNEQANRNNLILRLDKKNKSLYWEDLSKSIAINDVIEFRDDTGYLMKAVVTAKGYSGVTARDKEQRKLKVFYKDINNYYNRSKK